MAANISQVARARDGRITYSEYDWRADELIDAFNAREAGGR